MILTTTNPIWLQAGVSPLLQHQFEELAKQKIGDNKKVGDNKRRKLVVIGQDCIEPLQALRTAGREVQASVKFLRSSQI